MVSTILVPLAFPSHPGLIAPLWRRWPNRFAVLSASVGAVVPDVVDGLLGLHRGSLGQAYGHSVFGLCVLCLPIGLALSEAIEAAGRRLGRGGDGGFLRRLSAAIERSSVVPGRTGPARLFLKAWSVWVGALSHLLSDFVSHGNFLWLYPWHEDPRFFADWWYTGWFEIPLPFYESPYPCGPHFVVWVVLSILGGVLLFRRPAGSPDSPPKSGPDPPRLPTSRNRGSPARAASRSPSGASPLRSP